MPRLKKLREPGDTQVRKAWNKKKTRKYTIAITLDEKKEKRRKATKKTTTAKRTTTAKKTTAKKTTAKKTATKKPRKATKAGSKGKAKRGSK